MLTTAEWRAFLEAATRPMVVTRPDPFWWDGEVIDRTFAFVWAGGRLLQAFEQFALSTGKPPLPFEDPQGAWQDVVSDRVNYAAVVAGGGLPAPKITLMFQYWLMPDVIAYEINYLATDANETMPAKPSVPAGMDRWRKIHDALRTGSVRYDGQAGQAQRTRFIQTAFDARVDDGSLAEVRELGFGAGIDRVYDDPAAVWGDIAGGGLTPARDVEDGRFGQNLFVAFRVLRHGTMGHMAVFLRPGSRLGVA